MVLELNLSRQLTSVLTEYMFTKIDHGFLSFVETLAVKFGPGLWNWFLGFTRMNTVKTSVFD